MLDFSSMLLMRIPFKMFGSQLKKKEGFLIVINLIFKQIQLNFYKTKNVFIVLIKEMGFIVA